MKIKINIGKSQLEFEGRDYKEVIKEAAAFSQSTKCGLCDSQNVSLDYRYAVAKEGEKKGQGFDYYKIKCLDCGAYTQLGQYKTGGWFAKKWEIYNSGNSPSGNDLNQNEEVPFSG